MPKQSRILPSWAVLLATATSIVSGQTAPCPPLDSTATWARVNRAWSNEAGERWSNDSLRTVLLAMAAEDQAARKDFGASVGDTAYGRKLIAFDSTLAANLEVILDRFGLPTRSMVGAAGSDAAMLVVQHNWRLQERVLGLTRKVPTGSLSPQALAMLEDRVRVHQGKPQRFGTQFNLGLDGLFHFAPTADLPGLAARRERAGLPPMTQYVCMLEEAGMKVDRASVPRALNQP